MYVQQNNCFHLYFQGLNFQLAAVLLSLGVYTYVEYGMYIISNLFSWHKIIIEKALSLYTNTFALTFISRSYI